MEDEYRIIKLSFHIISELIVNGIAQILAGENIQKI